MAVDRRRPALDGLITGLLLREHRERGRIDLVGFWVRRVRRLLPALLLVLVVVALATWWAARPETWSALVCWEPTT